MGQRKRRGLGLTVALALASPGACGSSPEHATAQSDAAGKADEVASDADVVFVAVPREEWSAGLTIDGLPTYEVSRVEELALALDVPVAVDDPHGFRFAVAAVPVLAVMALGSFVLVAVSAQLTSIEQQRRFGARSWGAGSLFSGWGQRVAQPEDALESRDASLQAFLAAVAVEDHDFGDVDDAHDGRTLWSTVVLPELARAGSDAQSQSLQDDQQHPCGEEATPTFAHEDEGLWRWPYLQRVTDRSATVMFASTLASDLPAYIRFATADGPWREVAAGGELFSPERTGHDQAFTQYVADIDFLQPGASYCVDVYVGTTVVAQNLLLRTNKPGPRPVRILGLGDSGTDSEVYQYPLRDRFVDHDADLFLHVGDLAYDPDFPGKPATYRFLEKSFFRAYQTLMHRVPVYPALGNHEEIANEAEPYLSSFAFPELCSGVGGLGRFSCERLQETLPTGDRGRYYSFDHGNVHVVALDTNPEMLGDPARRQRMLEWLELDLASSAQPWKVAFFHQPPWVNARPGHDGVQSVREHVVPLLQQYRVDFALAGDSHMYERTHPLLRERDGAGELVDRIDEARGITYFTIGSGGREVSGNRAPAWFTAAHNVDDNAFVRLYILGCHMYGEAVGAVGQTLDSFYLEGC